MRRPAVRIAVLLLLLVHAPRAARADGFLGDGIIENTDSQQSGILATAIGTDGFYIAGLDYTAGTGSWRVEKRRLDDGELVPSFGDGGVLAVDPTMGWDGIQNILVEGESLFLVGSADTGLRIEKRSARSGRLKTLFGAAGAVSAPAEQPLFLSSNYAALARGNLYVATDSGRILRIRADTGELVGALRTASPSAPEYVAALAAGPAALFVGMATPQGFRLEKLGLHRGRVLWQVDEPFTQAGCWPEAPLTIALVPGSLVLGGTREGLWHIERRRRRDGAPVWSVTETGRGDCDAVYDIVADRDAFFAVGVHNSRRRIEKRRLADGALLEQFGNGGVIDGTRRTLEAFSAVKACGDLVVSGWASSVGEPTRWYSTRHDPTSGALAVEPRTACTERTRR